MALAPGRGRTARHPGCAAPYDMHDVAHAVPVRSELDVDPEECFRPAQQKAVGIARNVGDPCLCRRSSGNCGRCSSSVRTYTSTMSFAPAALFRKSYQATCSVPCDTPIVGRVWSCCPGSVLTCTRGPHVHPGVQRTPHIDVEVLVEVPVADVDDIRIRVVHCDDRETQRAKAVRATTGATPVLAAVGRLDRGCNRTQAGRSCSDAW